MSEPPSAPFPAGSAVPKGGGIIAELRPRQWIKNLLVLAAPVAAGIFDESDTAWRAAVAFVCFSAAASATYIVNDIRDREADRRHPTKCRRPIAAGRVSVPVALVVAGVLLIGGVVGAFALRAAFGWTIVAYLVLTTTYSLWLKRLPILDIVAVAAGFVLRAVGGAAATDVPISEWFFIVISFGALFMVAGKRAGESAELGEGAGAVRAVLDEYSPSFLTYLRAVFSGGTLIAYCLWAFSSAEQAEQGAILFQLSIVPFAVAILRYALLLDRGEGAEPETLILSDRTLMFSAGVWAIIYGCAIYAS